MFSLTLVIEIIHSEAENGISYNFLIKNNSCKNISSLKSTKKKDYSAWAGKTTFLKKVYESILEFPYHCNIWLQAILLL